MADQFTPFVEFVMVHLMFYCDGNFLESAVVPMIPSVGHLLNVGDSAKAWASRLPIDTLRRLSISNSILERQQSQQQIVETSREAIVRAAKSTFPEGNADERAILFWRVTDVIWHMDLRKRLMNSIDGKLAVSNREPFVSIMVTPCPELSPLRHEVGDTELTEN